MKSVLGWGVKRHVGKCGRSKGNPNTLPPTLFYTSPTPQNTFQYLSQHFPTSPLTYPTPQHIFSHLPQHFHTPPHYPHIYPNLPHTPHQTFLHPPNTSLLPNTSYTFPTLPFIPTSPHTLFHTFPQTFSHLLQHFPSPSSTLLYAFTLT